MISRIERSEKAGGGCDDDTASNKKINCVYLCVRVWRVLLFKLKQ
jgi:hypothetical protein